MSDQGYRVLIDHLQDGIFAIEESRLVYVNQRLAEMLGYTCNELIGLPFINLVAAEDRLYILERHRARLSGENVPEQYDIRLCTSFGTIICCSLSIGLTENQHGRTVTVGSARDVTQQNAAQAELAASKAELKSILDQLPDVFYRTNMQGVITMISPSCLDVLGYTQEEAVGSMMVDYYESPETRTQIVQAITDGGGKATQVEAAFRHKNGSIIWMSTNAFLRMGEDGKPAYVEGITRDITERIKSERTLLKLVSELEEKELAKTRFLAAAGHDLRQPVAAASLFLDALKFSSPTPQQLKLIDKLDQSMNIFSGLLARLLDISKFDAGLIKAEFKSHRLPETMGWLEQNFARVAGDKQLSFRIFTPRNNALITNTDTGLLQSVLMNLVTNAIKFTQHGGILIALRPRGDRVLLQVWDTGIGIAQSDIPHIFAEFHQVGNPQRNRKEGLGLGLSICQRSMALLNGEVICRSRPGKGSVFEISLPLLGAQEESSTPQSGSALLAMPNASLMQGKNIVVLEDDELVAWGLIGLLQKSGATVTHYTNGEDALQYAALQQTDFFVVDYALDGPLTGLDFLMEVRQKLGMPIRAVLCTGETSSQFIGKVADCPWPVIYKPINYRMIASGLSMPAA